MNDASASSWDGLPAEQLRALWQLPALLLFDTIDSTNDVARARAAEGADAGLLVLADHQSAGRGQHGRQWTAPAGAALLMSFVLRPAAVADLAPGTAPLRVGLAVARALQAATGIATSIKWPNDVIAHDGRKLAGILCEAATAGGATCVIAGIGINVHQQPQDWPPALRATATSLDEVTGAVCDRKLIMRALITEMRPLFTAALGELTRAELAEYATRDALRGRSIVISGRDELRADAAGVAPDGALLVTSHGDIRRVTSATVRLADQPRYSGAAP